MILKKTTALLLGVIIGATSGGCNKSNDDSFDNTSSSISTDYVDSQLPIEGDIGNTDFDNIDLYFLESFMVGVDYLDWVIKESEKYGSISSLLNETIGISLDQEHAKKYDEKIPLMYELYKDCLRAYQENDKESYNIAFNDLAVNMLFEEDIVYLYSLRINNVKGENIINDPNNILVNYDGSINVDGVTLRSVCPINSLSCNIFDIYNKKVNASNSLDDSIMYNISLYIGIPYLLHYGIQDTMCVNMYDEYTVEDNPELSNVIYISYSLEIKLMLEYKLSVLSEILGHRVCYIDYVSNGNCSYYVVYDEKNKEYFYESDSDIGSLLRDVNIIVSYYDTCVNDGICYMDDFEVLTDKLVEWDKDMYDCNNKTMLS